MSSQTTLAQLPVGQIGFGAMRITGPGIWVCVKFVTDAVLDGTLYIGHTP